MGNAKLLEEAEIDVPKDIAAYVGQVQRDARTCVLVAINREVAGSLAITDRPPRGRGGHRRAQPDGRAQSPRHGG